MLRQEVLMWKESHMLSILNYPMIWKYIRTGPVVRHVQEKAVSVFLFAIAGKHLKFASLKKWRMHSFTGWIYLAEKMYAVNSFSFLWINSLMQIHLMVIMKLTCPIFKRNLPT